MVIVDSVLVVLLPTAVRVFRAQRKLLEKESQVVKSGEIGIFIVNGECFIKEAAEDGLLSHNPKYKAISGNEHIICVGRVLGKVPEKHF